MTENELKFMANPQGDTNRMPYQGSHHIHQAYQHPRRKLYRSTRDKWIAGVCGGIAEYYDQDPVIIRLIWIAVTIFSVGVGVIAYLLFWAFVKKYPSYYLPPPPQVGAVHYHYYYKSSQNNQT